MKIAIAATSQESDAQISAHAARAPYYLILNTESGVLDALANPASESERGAGPQAALFLIGRGVNKIVAGGFGHKFLRELEGSGIVCAEETGSVSGFITVLGA